MLILRPATLPREASFLCIYIFLPVLEIGSFVMIEQDNLREVNTHIPTKAASVRKFHC